MERTPEFLKLLIKLYCQTIFTFFIDRHILFKNRPTVPRNAYLYKFNFASG